MLGLLLLVALAPATAATQTKKKKPAPAEATAGEDEEEDDVQTMVELAEQWVNKRMFKEAKAILKDAIDLDPSYPEAHIQLGRAHAFMGDLDEAEELYRHALTLDPQYVHALTSLGKLYLFQKRIPEALQQFRAALVLSPTDGDAHLGLARLEAQEAKDDKAALQRAAALYEKALALQPTNEQAWFDCGVVLSQLGKHEEAAAKFDQSIALNERQMNFFLLGQVYQSFGQIPRALASFERGLLKEPHNSDALQDAGQCLELLGRSDEALAFYRKALVADPKHAAAHASLGLLLAGTGVVNYGAQQACGLHTAEVVEHLTQAVEKDEGEDALPPTVKEALAFCETEAKEVEEWTKRLAALRQKVGKVDAAPVAKKEKKEEDVPAATDVAVAAASDEKPLVVLRKTVLGHLHTVLRFIRTLASTLQRLVASFKGEGTQDMGVWINGKKIKSLPAVNITSSTQFMAKYVKKNRPVVVKNFQAAFAGPEAWTHAALVEKFGEMPVRVSLSQTGRFDGPENGTLWGLGADDEVLVRPPQTTMRFQDFADLLRLARAAPSQAPAANFYLEYTSLTQYLGEEMLALIPMPPAASASGMVHFLTNFWMGKGDTTSPLHYDDYENLLCQIKGVKELTLFPPGDIAYLYYTGRAKGLLEYTYPSTFQRKELVSAKGVSVVFGSSVLLDAPDLARHPDLVKATPYKVRLEAGDVLYLPAYWHHEVTSLPDEEEGLNIAVNFWFRNETTFAQEAAGLDAAAKAQAARKKKQ